jgi:excisionase family DNA binding protein
VSTRAGVVVGLVDVDTRVSWTDTGGLWFTLDAWGDVLMESVEDEEVGEVERTSPRLVPNGGGAANEPILLVTPEEAGRRLSIGRTTVYELMADGELESVLVRRCRRIPVKALVSFVDRLQAADSGGDDDSVSLPQR